MFVAFAGTGGTPAKSSAGNATKLPPPATELMRAAHRGGEEEERARGERHGAPLSRA